MKHRLLVAFGLASLLTGMLSAQDGLQFAQGIGAQYDSKLGFVPSYRVELTAPLVRNPGLSLEAKVSNDFAVLADTLGASLAVHFRLAPLVSFTLETPTSVTFRVLADFQAQLAGSAKLAVSNQQDSQNRPGPVPSGWVLGSELSSTASAAFGNRPTGQGLLYQAAGQLEVGYQSAVVSPNLKLVATADLGALKLTDVKSTASLNFNWDHLLGSVSVGVSLLSTSPVYDYAVGVGYRF